MRQVIRDYLVTRKESKEIDALLPDLLLSMGIDILSRPGIGSRQFGVDISAVGIDPKDNRQKLFLLTVKEGDINRSSWNGGKNAVRPSLEEILDSYLRNRVRPEHEALPKKIILATGGELKQDVEPDWVNFVHRYTNSNSKYGEIEFDFWGGDQLTLLIEQYFLDEYLFPKSAQKYLRKTIAIADQNEDEPRYFYELIEDTLFHRDLPLEKNKSAERKRQKTLCLLDLSLNIVFHWCQEADNLRPVLFCAERAVLRTWDWMRQNDLFDCNTTKGKFEQLFSTYLKVISAYTTKLQPHCFVRDSLFGYGADELEYSLRTFEVIGIFGTLGMVLAHLFAITSNEELCRSYQQQMLTIARMLAALIKNNPSAFTPRYDGHAIDITLGLLTLTAVGYVNQAAHWLKELSYCIVFAYNIIGKHFPIVSDSYDELVAMEVGQAPPKEKLMEASTLLPMLASWYAVLNLKDDYRQFQEAVTRTFTNTSLQLWFPDEETDNHLYSSNAGYDSGFTFQPFRLPQSLDELKTYIIRLHEKYEAFDNLSCFTKGLPVMGLIASRHFRTPIIPGYWQQYICDLQISSEETPEDKPANE